MIAIPRFMAGFTIFRRFVLEGMLHQGIMAPGGSTAGFPTLTQQGRTQQTNSAGKQ